MDYAKVSFVGWLIGILFASIYTNSFLYMVPIVAAVGIFIWTRTTKMPNRVLVAVMLMLGFAACGMVYFSHHDHRVDSLIAALPFGEKVTIDGTVTTPSEAASNGSQFVIKGSLRKGSEAIKFQVRESEGKDYMYGDAVHVAGLLEAPEPFETQNGSMFDYQSYLKKDGVLGIIKATVVQKGIENVDGKMVPIRKGNPIIRGLFSFNAKLEDTIKTLIPGMKGSLSSGILLGDKQITKENRDAFVTTGTTHIIALSGYNVSIVSNFFRELFSFLPLVGALCMGGLAIVIFLIMTGLQSSAVRAGIMACIILFAKAKGREAHIGIVILLAGVVMTIVNPYTLFYDVSAQLSFIATLGIVYFAPTVAHWFTKVPEKKIGLPLREMIGGTIGTQLFVLPFILWKTGTLSVVSPLTNILIMPFVPYLMACTAIVACVSLLYMPLAVPFAFVASIIAGLILGIIKISAQIPYAAFTFSVPWWAMAGMYTFLIIQFEPFSENTKQKTVQQLSN